MPKKNICYMLYSKKGDTHFISSTNDDLQERIDKHNNDEKNGGQKMRRSSSLMNFKDWEKSCHIRGFKTKEQAKGFENQLRFKIRNYHYTDSQQEKKDVMMGYSQEYKGLTFVDDDEDEE